MKKTIFLCLVSIFFSSCALWEEKSPSATPTNPNLSIMSYNIHVGKGIDGKISLERIVEDIRKAGADVIGIQEVDRFTKRNPVDQVAELKKLSGFDVVFSRNIDYMGGEYGIAIMSRYPILETKRFHYNPMENRESRGALAVKIHPEALNISKPIWFITTHLGTDSSGLEQKSQVVELFAWMNDFKTQGYLIISGDMNQTPKKPAIQIFTPDFTDLWIEAGKGDGFTFNALDPSKRIDYLFIRRKDLLSCKNVIVLDSIASDHRPVVAQIILR